MGSKHLIWLGIQMNAALSIETLPDFPGVPTDGLRVHCSSGLVHVVNEDDYLLCGRPMSRNFVLLSDVSVPGHVDSCQHCLRIFKRSMEP